MKVLVADMCGFCQGVTNAIQLAKKTLSEESDVYSLGSIIHNDDVVRELSQSGLKTVQTVEEIESGTVLIRSHGATKDQLQQIRDKGLTIVDATCVLVKRLQKISQELSDGGYKVVIIGDEGHPEVKAVVGFADNVAVVGNEDDLDKLSRQDKLGIICQTTQSPDHFSKMVAAIVKKGFSDMRVINTLCREAIRRQDSAVELCRKVDVMFVLGGLRSANTHKLAELCRQYNDETFHLQNWEGLDKCVLIGKNIAGVTAGASTPDRVIKEFVRNLKSFDVSKAGLSKE